MRGENEVFLVNSHHPQGPSDRAKGRKERRAGSPRMGIRERRQQGERRQGSSSAKNGVVRALAWNLRWSKERV